MQNINGQIPSFWSGDFQPEQPTVPKDSESIEKQWHMVLAAAQAGDTVRALSLLSSLGPTVELPEQRQACLQHVEALLDVAIQRGNTALIGSLLSQPWIDYLSEKSMKTVGPRGETLLHWASFVGNETTVRRLLDRGLSLEARDLWGYTPLHWSSWYGNIETTEELITSGASPLLKTTAGQTPACLAMDAGHRFISQHLLHILHTKFPMSVVMSEIDAERIALLAAFCGRMAVVSRLVTSGEISPKLTDSKGSTLLHWAASYGDVALTELLLAHGAVIESRDSYGQTPLHVAVMGGSFAVVDALLNLGADPNPANSQLETPLHLAAIQRHPEIVQCLLQHPMIQVDVYNSTNQTPLLIALRNVEGTLQSYSELFQKTVALQSKRLTKKIGGKPYFSLTRAQNLQRSLEASTTMKLTEEEGSIRDEAVKSYEAYGSFLEKNQSLVATSNQDVEEIRFFFAPERWSDHFQVVSRDSRMTTAARLLGPHITMCDATAWILVHHLTTKGESIGSTGVGGINLLHINGVQSLRRALQHDTASFYHCFTALKIENSTDPVGDHTFVIQRVESGRYRIYQSYINHITLEQVLSRTAYGSLEGGDLNGADLEIFLQKLERLEKETWTTTHRRIYRDLFHASNTRLGQQLQFSFYSSDGKS